MTYPVFSTGDVLNASDMNAVGLWLVKTQTVGTAVTSVTVSDCFNANYDNYRVIFSGIDCSSAAVHYYIQFGTAVTNYYSSAYFDLYTGGNTGTVRTNNGSFIYAGVQDIDNTSAAFDVFRPYLTTVTTAHGTMYGGGYAGWFGGVHSANASHTSLKMTLGAGTMTGGTIKVYGYRN